MISRHIFVSLPLWHLRVFKDAILDFFRLGSIVTAGNMAFFGMLSLFPSLICLIAISGLMGQTEAGQEAIGVLLDSVPPEVAGAIKGPIDSVVGASRRSFVTLSMVMALWSASSGIEAARDGILNAYGRHLGGSYLRRRFESLIIVVLTAVLILAAMAIQVAVPALDQAVRGFIDVPPAVDRIIAWSRYGVSPVLLFLALYGLFLMLTPGRAFDRLYRAPGALFALVIWLSSAYGLSLYLQTFGQYDVTYGSLAGIIVTLIFFYIVSIAFLLGAHLNQAYGAAVDKIKDEMAENQHQEAATTD